MAAVVLQGTLCLSRQHLGVSAAAVSALQHASYSTDLRVKKPTLSQMRKGAGGRSSFNGVVATVFGCTGFMGRYVCNELGKHGSQLILPYRGDVYDVFPLKLVGDLGQVLFHPFNLTDEESIRQAVKYSNVVINLIGRDWETKNYTFDDVHVKGARRLARISREMGVERFIHISALNATPKPKAKMIWGGSGVLKSKYYGEIAVREEFPEATILRPSIVYGLEDRWLMRHGHFLRYSFHNRAFPLFNKGQGVTKLPVSVDDIATAIYEIIKNPATAGQTYQAIGPHRYHLYDLMLWIMNEMRMGDSRITDLRLSPVQIAKILAFEKLPGHPVGNMTREVMEMESTNDQVDYAAPTLVDLGFNPAPLSQHITWLLRHHKLYAYIGTEVGEFGSVVPPTPVD